MRRNARQFEPQAGPAREQTVPWALEVQAVSSQDPAHLVQSLTSAILGCGGWVLSRGASDTGRVTFLFEFERRACLEMYTLLIAAGIELSQNGHIRFTELCQCTRNQMRDCGAEIASVDLEIQTIPMKSPGRARPADGGISGEAA